MRAYHAATVRRINVRMASASLLAAVWLLVAGSAPVQAECDPTICSGDPCTITGTHVIDTGCDLDFGCARVTIGATASLQGDNGSYTIEAGDLTVRGTLRARAGSIGVTTTACGLATGLFKTEIYGSSAATVDVSSGGDVTITAGGDCVLNGRVINADESWYYSINMTCANVSGTSAIHADGSGGNSGGMITIAATPGYVNLNSSITANGGGEYAYGGSVEVDAATTLTVGGSSKPVQAKGAQGGDGGSISLTAGDAATINGSMNVSGGGDTAGGGDITVDAASITTGTAWYANGSQSGDGGSITLWALPAAGAGTITTTTYNLLNAVGGSGGGYGGAVDVESNGTMNLSGDMSVAGSGTADWGADGGTIDIAASGAATLNSSLNANGSGDWGWGGDITVSAAGLTTGNSSVMKALSGSGGYGGTIDVSAAGSIDSSGDMDAGGTGAGASGGSVSITAGNGSSDTLTLRSTSYIQADSGGTDPSTSDGTVDLSGCNIDVSGVVDTRNIYLSGGANSFSYAGTFVTNAGSSLLANDDGGNNVSCRCVDANADSICDLPLTCANALPTFNGTVTPDATITPVMMPACS